MKVRVKVRIRVWVLLRLGLGLGLGSGLGLATRTIRPMTEFHRSGAVPMPTDELPVIASRSATVHPSGKGQFQTERSLLSLTTAAGRRRPSDRQRGEHGGQAHAAAAAAAGMLPSYHP